MVVTQPAVNAAQIKKWIRQAAERRQIAAAAQVAEEVTAVEAPPLRMIHEVPFDFNKARLPLLRARAKSSIRVVKPLRRLLTNQEAINEGLVDAVAALIAINKSMAAEIDALTAQLNGLPAQNGSRSKRR